MCRRARFSCTWEKNASWPSLNFEDEGTMTTSWSSTTTTTMSILSILSILSKMRKWQVDSHSISQFSPSPPKLNKGLSWQSVWTGYSSVHLVWNNIRHHSTSLPQSTQRTSKSQRSMRCCASSANNAGHLLTKAGCGYDKTCTCYALLPQTSSEFHSWKRWSFKIWLSLLMGH